MNVLLNIDIHHMVITAYSSHTEILVHNYNIIPSKSSLIFRAVNMTGKREDNSAIPFINVVKLCLHHVYLSKIRPIYRSLS